jgi:hypothetical protein
MLALRAFVQDYVARAPVVDAPSDSDDGSDDSTPSPSGDGDQPEPAEQPPGQETTPPDGQDTTQPPDGQGTTPPDGENTNAPPEENTPPTTGEDTNAPPDPGTGDPAGEDTGGAGGEVTGDTGGQTDGFLGIGGDDLTPITLGSSGDDGADDTPKFTDKTEIKPVTGDTVQEWVANANGAMGQVGAIGHLATSWGWKPTMDESDQVTKVNMWLETTINGPRRGLGRGRSDEEDKLIDQAKALIIAHEKRHREIAKKVATAAVNAARGLKFDAAKAKLEEMMSTVLNSKQLALDSTEGKVAVVFGNGTAKPATAVKLEGV